MKRLIAIAAIAAATASPTFAATNVGVSIDFNQPGVYGRIELGNLPPPTVVYAQPVIIAPTPVAVYQRPIYLYVPTVHQGNWGRYCGRYAACGQPVYFVRDTWVREHGPRSDGRWDRRDDRRDDRRGKKKGKGRDD